VSSTIMADIGATNAVPTASNLGELICSQDLLTSRLTVQKSKLSPPTNLRAVDK
jgi:hypothetical protein